MENRGTHFSRLLQKLLVSSKGTKQITKVVTTKKCNTEEEEKPPEQRLAYGRTVFVAIREIVSARRFACVCCVQRNMVEALIEGCDFLGVVRVYSIFNVSENKTKTNLILFILVPLAKADR